MSAFADGLVRGPWYVQTLGGYLATSSQNDPAGNPFLTIVPGRAAASKLSFGLVARTSDSVVEATLTEAVTGRQLTVNSENMVVLGPSSGGATFTLSQRRPSLFSAQAPGQKTVAYVASSGHFEATASAAGPAPLALTGDLPAASLLWSRRLGSAALGAPAIFEGFQVVSGRAPFMTGVESATGRIAWECEEPVAATSPPVVSWSARTAIAAAGATVYGVSIDDATVTWKPTVSSSVYARPRAVADMVFVCASYGVLHALAVADGSERWRYPAQGSTLGGLYATPALQGGILFVGAWDGSLHALEAASGKQIWYCGTSEKVNGVPLATADGVYFGNDAGAVYALDPASGIQRWTVSVGELVQARPAIAGGMLLVAASSGTVYGLDLRSGAQRWSVDLGGQVNADVAVSDGIAYLTTTDGKLHALALAANGPPTHSSISMGGPSAGSLNVFSGAVYASTLAGVTVANGCGLRPDLRPADHAALLQASGAADKLTPGQTPNLPPSWTAVGTAFASSPQPYATALVATLARPSDDAPIVLVAFGVEPIPFLNRYDPGSAALKEVPAAIAGANAPSGIQATDSVIDNYASMRGAVLSLIGGLGGKTVMVTGHGQGGALAALAALDYASVKSDTPAPAALICVSFGAPPAGNAAFASRLEALVPSCFRAVVAGDPTVHSLGSAWRHAGARVTLGQTFPALLEPGSIAAYAAAMKGRA